MSEPATSHEGRVMSLDEFQNWNQKDECGRKFEWKAGILESAGTWMAPGDRTIVANLCDRFVKTEVWRRGSELFCQSECWLEKVDALRIPDLAWFTLEQIRESENGGQPVPAWVIEIISSSETVYRTEGKVLEYFHAGVEVVWHIIPEPVQKVRIFSRDGGIRDLVGDGVCSASPALDEFSIRAAEVFQSR